MSKTLLRASLVSAVVAVVTASNLSGQEILVHGLNGDLWSSNPKTGQMSFIGAAGFQNPFWAGLAMDSQGHLFAATGDFQHPYAIYEINPQTGAGTFVAQTALYGLSAMAFGPGDVLYVANDRTAPLGTRPMDLYTLDLATGLTSLIGDTGIHNMLAMDFHQGILYGYPYNLGLVTIDTATGLATDVNPNYRGPNGSTVSMCFAEGGALYYIDAILWMMDSETGVASAVDVTLPTGFWTDAVFVEGPAQELSVWFAGTSGGPMQVKVSGATPHGTVAVVIASGGGPTVSIPAGRACAGATLALNATSQLLSSATADAAGETAFGPQQVPASAAGVVRVQAVDLTTCTTSNRALLVY